MLTLTSSRIRTHRTCHRLHHYLYNLSIKPRTDHKAPALGTLVHVGLEAHWSGHDPVKAMTLKWERQDPLDRYDLEMACALLEHYPAYRWEPVAVELEFSGVPIADGVSAAGKVDMLAKIDGELYVVEHKTTAMEIDQLSPYWTRLSLDTQISFYISALRKLGRPVVGMMYDVLRKPNLARLYATPPAKRKYRKDGQLYATQRLQDETPEEYRGRLDAALNGWDTYYGTRRIIRTEEQIAEFDREIIHESHLMLNDEVHSRNDGACMKWGRLCHFHGVCSGNEDLNSPKFRKGRRHEELSSI